MVGGALSASIAFAATALAAPGPSRVSAAFPPPVANVASVACFTATGCVAVGWSTLPGGADPTPLELRTTDGGALWVPVVVPHVASQLRTVACAGLVCVAGGTSGSVLHSPDGGRTWAAAALPAPFASVVAVACPSATSCVAEGHDGTTGASGLLASSGDGGATWASQYKETTSDLQALWCARPTACVAYGTSYLGTSDGSTWGPVLPAAGFPTEAVCPTALTCVGSSPAEGIVTSSDGGTTWTISDGSFVPTSLSCGSATACVGTDGANLVITTDGGKTWSEETPGFAGDTLAAVACATGAECQVVGSALADGYPDRALLLGVVPSTGAFTPEVAANAVDTAVAATCPPPRCARSPAPTPTATRSSFGR